MEEEQEEQEEVEEVEEVEEEQESENKVIFVAIAPLPLPEELMIAEGKLVERDKLLFPFSCWRRGANVLFINYYYCCCCYYQFRIIELFPFSCWLARCQCQNRED